MASFTYDQLVSTVDSLEKKYGIPSGMYRDLIMKGERSGPTSVSPKGAIGFAQLMPGTARDMGVHDVWDPVQNLEGGAKYFKTQYDDFGDWRVAGAAYNAGPQRVREAGGIPDFKETHDYLGRVFGPMANNAAAGPSGGLDPKVDQQLMASMQAAQAHAAEVSKHVEGQLDESNKRIQEINNAPMPERPMPPTLKDVPMPPEYTKMMHDPTKVLGQTLPALAVLGSMFTRHSATNALKTAAAAMKASQTNDKDAILRAHDEWKDHMDALITQNRTETDRYVNVLEDRRMSLQEKQAELSTLAAMDNNAQLKALIANGQYDQLWKFLQARDSLAYRAAQVYDMAERRDIDRSKLALESRKADELNAYRNLSAAAASARASRETLSQFVSRLSEQKLTGKTETGADWDKDHEEALSRAEADLQKLNFGSPGGGGGGGSPGPKDMPVPLPANESQLVDQQVYQGKAGPRRWDAKSKSFVTP